MGQGFNQRYDPNGLGRAQTAWGIEQYGGTGHFVFTASSEIDTLGPDSVVYYAAIFVSRIDLSGDTVFNRKHYLPGYGIYPGWANCCDTTQNGFIVGGGRQSFAGVDEVYLIRLNGLGDTLWTRVFGGTNQYWIGRQVKRTLDGGFLIVGDTDASGYVDGFALKTDSLGNEQWRQTYGWSAAQIDGLLSCDRAPGNTYYMAGSRYVNNDNRDMWLQRTDTNGALLWRVSWGGPYDDGSGHMSTLQDGNVIIANAHGYSFDGTQFRIALTKLDSADGTILWDHEYGPEAANTLLFAAKERPNGDLIACGVSYASGDQQGLLLRTTSTGDSIWMRSYYYQDTLITTGQGRFYDVLPTQDGGYIAAGSAYNPAGAPYPPGYSQDTWVVKLDSMGCLVPGCDGVGVQEVVERPGHARTVLAAFVSAGVHAALGAYLHAGAGGEGDDPTGPTRATRAAGCERHGSGVVFVTRGGRRALVDRGALGGGVRRPAPRKGAFNLRVPFGRPGGKLDHKLTATTFFVSKNGSVKCSLRSNTRNCWRTGRISSASSPPLR